MIRASKGAPRLGRGFSIAFTGLIIILVLAAFGWPLFIEADAAQANMAQFAFMAVMPLLLALLMIEFSNNGLGSRQLAVLGVLIALNAVVRMLGAGVAGIETAFFLVIIASYVFGGGFGFILGGSSMVLSALLSGGVGPWLPFQMMAMGLVGIGAGLLPKSQSPRLILSSYALIAAFVYGGLMTMWNWPFLAGTGSAVSYLPGAGILENLIRFLRFELVSGGLIWDLGRAVTTIVLIWLTTTTLLATLGRAAGRAAVAKLKS